MSESPSGPVAIVTGAGAGIGRATVLRLADAGWRTQLVGRTRATLDETARLIDERPSAAETLITEADISEGDAPTSIVDAALERWHRIDALVNNAGGVEMVPLVQTDADLLSRMFEVNTFGPARLIARVLGVFEAQHAGCIVNVSSMAVFSPFPGLAAYAAAKSALDSLTRSIMNEHGDAGVRAFSVAPGAVETSMLRSLFSTDQLPSENTLDPDTVAQVIVDCVLGRRDAEAGSIIQVPSPQM